MGLLLGIGKAGVVFAAPPLLLLPLKPTTANPDPAELVEADRPPTPPVEPVEVLLGLSGRELKPSEVELIEGALPARVRSPDEESSK